MDLEEELMLFKKKPLAILLRKLVLSLEVIQMILTALERILLLSWSASIIFRERAPHHRRRTIPQDTQEIHLTIGHHQETSLRRIMHATNARKLVTSLQNVLYGKSKTNPSTHTAIPQASHTNPTKPMSRRSMSQGQEETRKMILMMARRRSITRSVRVLPRSLIPLVEGILTEQKLIWVKKWTPMKKPLAPKQNEDQGLDLDLNLMVLPD